MKLEKEKRYKVQERLHELNQQYNWVLALEICILKASQNLKVNTKKLLQMLQLLGYRISHVNIYYPQVQFVFLYKKSNRYKVNFYLLLTHGINNKLFHDVLAHLLIGQGSFWVDFIHQLSHFFLM